MWVTLVPLVGEAEPPVWAMAEAAKIATTAAARILMVFGGLFWGWWFGCLVGVERLKFGSLNECRLQLDSAWVDGKRKKKKRKRLQLTTNVGLALYLGAAGGWAGGGEGWDDSERERETETERTGPCHAMPWPWAAEAASEGKRSPPTHPPRLMQTRTPLSILPILRATHPAHRTPDEAGVQGIGRPLGIGSMTCSQADHRLSHVALPLAVAAAAAAASVCFWSYSTYCRY